MATVNGEPRTARARHLGPARRRPLVLDGALRLLLSRDSSDVSMEAIADICGVTKPVVYSCFPSKTELLGALLEREEQRMLAHVAAALPEQPNFEDPAAGTRASFTSFLTAVAAEPDSWRLMLLAERGNEPEIRRRVARGRQVQVEAVRGLNLAVYEAAGVPDAERKAEVSARAMVAAGEMAAGLILDQPDRWTPEELAEMLTRLFMQGAGSL